MQLHLAANVSVIQNFVLRAETYVFADSSDSEQAKLVDVCLKNGNTRNISHK